MRFAVIANRPVIVDSDSAFDVTELSEGRFGPDPLAVYEDWAAFREWADSVELPAQGEPFDPEVTDSPVPLPRQIFGIGLNYREHQIESGLPAPDVPLVFTKFPTSVTGANGIIELPSGEVDWEVEAAIVIGVKGHRISAASAWDHVAGVTASQDISARDIQMRPAGTPQFSLGKSFPGFTPLGPVLITPEELPDRNDISVACALNGETVQSSSTGDLIFDIPTLIEYLSGIVTLLPGDLILSGTPSGVGIGRSPKVFLADGDRITTSVADLTMNHHFVSSQGSVATA